MTGVLVILAILSAALAQPPRFDRPSFDPPLNLSLSKSPLILSLSKDERLAQDRPHWPIGTTILVWIDARNAPPGADALVERAMKTWTDAARRRFHLKRTSARDAASLRVHVVRGAARTMCTAKRNLASIGTPAHVEALGALYGRRAGAP